MSVNSFNEQIEIVIKALQQAGYKPYDQLYGYITTGDATYITRQNNARDIVGKLDKNELRIHLMKMKR